MEKWLQPAVFGLAGSLLTIIIRWIIDSFNKRIQFNREIKKDFLSFQIKSADSITGLVHANIHYVTIIINAINSLVEHYGDENYDVDYLGDLIDKNIHQLESNEEKLMNSSAYLYFRLDEQWTTDNQRNLIDLVSKFSIIKADVAILEEDYEELNEEQQIEIDRMIESLREEALSLLIEINGLLVKYQTSILKSLDLIKAEIRKQFKQLNK
ncbi:hypothetical protein [Ekhidna sp.]|uniref:hypothetical protein n=1 Tax=Ekhidna sp. TaxID=2608089 RepID=UPI003B5A7902